MNEELVIMTPLENLQESSYQMKKEKRENKSYQQANKNSQLHFWILKKIDSRIKRNLLHIQ